MGHLRAAPLICADRLLAGLAARAPDPKGRHRLHLAPEKA